MVDVFYLDYGQPECVTLDRLCNSTPGDIASRPALARYITLEGVKPVSVRCNSSQDKNPSFLVDLLIQQISKWGGLEIKKVS